jgi:hypothetical protein
MEGSVFVLILTDPDPRGPKHTDLRGPKPGSLVTITWWDKLMGWKDETGRVMLAGTFGSVMPARLHCSRGPQHRKQFNTWFETPPKFQYGLGSNVVDPDSVGLASFCQIRDQIRQYWHKNQYNFANLYFIYSGPVLCSKKYFIRKALKCFKSLAAVQLSTLNLYQLLNWPVFGHGQDPGQN